MAETKPATTPEWNTGGANRTTPNGAKIILGWELNEEPSSAFFNWLQHWVGACIKWLYERISDGNGVGGGDEEDLCVMPPTPATHGGGLYLRGASANTTGIGGPVSVTAGTSASGAAGGTATLSGGRGATTYAGGYAFVNGGQGGPSGGDGGTVVSSGGNATGTDKNGGTAIVGGGVSTGSGSSSVVVQATEPHASGTTEYDPVEYLKADGTNKQLTASKSLVATATDATRAPVRVTAQAADPSSPAEGDLAVHATSGKPSVYDGSGWGRLVPQVKATALDAAGDQVTATSPTAFATKYTIPANTLRVGSSIRVRAAGKKTGTAGTMILEVYVGNALIGYSLDDASATMIAANVENWGVDCEAVVRTVGATGRLEGGGTVTTGRGAVNAYTFVGGNTNTTAAIDVVIKADMASGDASDLRMLRVDVT